MSVTHPPVISIVPEASEVPEGIPAESGPSKRSPAIRWSEVPVRVVLGFDDDSKPRRIRLEFFDGDRKTLPLGDLSGETLDDLGRRLLSAFQRKIDETGHVHPW